MDISLRERNFYTFFTKSSENFIIKLAFQHPRFIDIIRCPYPQIEVQTAVIKLKFIHLSFPNFEISWYQFKY